MATKEQLAAIRDIAAKKRLSPEQRAALNSWLEKQESTLPEQFAKKRQEEISMMGGAGDPIRGPLMAGVAEDVAMGLSPEEIANLELKALPNVLDIGTGAGPTRAAIGSLMGVKPELDKALLEGFKSGSEIVEQSPSASKMSPLMQTVTATGLDIVDPGMILGGANLLKGTIKGAGKDLYRSGLKNIDKAVWKKGKEMNAFSDAAMKYGIRGSAEDVFNQTDEVLEQLLRERDSILADAATRGAVVDAERVLKPVVKDAKKLATSSKVIDSNVKNQAVKMANDLEAFAQANKRIPEILPEPVQVPAFFPEELPIGGMRSKEGVMVTAEAVSPKATPSFGPQMEVLPESAQQGQLELLPRTEAYASKVPTPAGEMPYTILQGESGIKKGQQSLLRPGDVMGESTPIPAVGGLSPTESSSIKTQLYNMLGSEPYGILRQDKKGQGLLKKAAARFNTATTEAVRKVDPKAAKRLRELNKDMGGLLTGRPAAWNEASKEITKNAVTSVDAPLAILNPQAYLGKKAADIGKTASFRTNVGSALANDTIATLLGGVGGAGISAAKARAINAYLKTNEEP